jgi:hypothetical protein
MAVKRRCPSFVFAALGVLLSLVVSACSPVSRGDAEGGWSFEATVAVLSSAGIAVYDDPADEAPLVPASSPVSPVRLLSWQVEALWREAARFGGLTAAELDGLFTGGLDEEFEGVVVSPAAVIVAWAEAVDTPAARHARELLAGPPDWPEELGFEDRPVFSDFVLILFMSDVAVAGASLPGAGPTAIGEAKAVEVLAAGEDVVADLLGDACTKGIQFLNGTVAAAFDAVANLLTPPPINTGFGLFDALANAVVGVVVGAAHVVIRGVQIFVNDVLIDLTVGQVMKTVAMIAGFVGALAQVTSLVKPWEVVLEPTPNPIWVAAAPAERGNTGSVTASVLVDAGTWPRWMEQCAEAADRKLPNLRPEGNVTRWDFRTIPGPLAVGTEVDGQLRSDGTARFEYVTTIQDPSGEPRRGDLWTTVYIDRDDASQLAGLIAEVLRTGTSTLFPLLNEVPPIAELVHAEALNLARLVLPPVERELHRLLRRYTAHRFHDIMYYVPKEPETTIPSPPPPARPPGGPGEEERPPPPPCEFGCGESHGDPHMVTVDGHWYEFQAAGEFVLLRSTDGTVEIQARYEPVLPADDFPFDVSYATAVAARLGPHRAVWYEGSGVSVDGEPLPSGDVAELAGGRVEAFPGGMVVDFADGTALYAIAGGYLAIVIDASDDLYATGVGLLGRVRGTGLGVPPMPDGTVLPGPTDRESHFDLLYRQLGPAWRVSETTSLFDYLDGESPDTFFLDDFPRVDRVAFYLSEILDELLRGLSPDLFADEAERACAGVDDPNLNQMCMFDVAVTGDESWAGQYEATQRLYTEGPFQALGGDDSEPPLPIPVAGRAGQPTLQLRGDIGGPRRSTLVGSIDAAEGTVLLARIASCPPAVDPEVGISLEVRVRDFAGEPGARARATLCGSDRLVFGLGDDDEFVPTEAFVWLASAGVHDVTLSTTSHRPVSVEVEVFVDPNPTVVRADGDPARFDATYRLQGIADTVVYEFTHSFTYSGLTLNFSQPSGFGIGGACGKLEFGAPGLGEPIVWDLRFCGHSDIVFVGHLTEEVIVPMVVFNRTGAPIEVTLGPPD